MIIPISEKITKELDALVNEETKLFEFQTKKTIVTRSLFAELQDHELKAASALLRVSVRAAGTLASVIL